MRLLARIHIGKTVNRLLRGWFSRACARGLLPISSTGAQLAPVGVQRIILEEIFRRVLRYLSRYTHRVAISNRRLVAADDAGIAFRWKDYRVNGPDRWKTMRLHPQEFIRRFLIHVLPKGFHRIRHYGLFASTNRAQSIATARALLNVAPPNADPPEQPDVASPDTPRVLPYPCPCCGARMIVIETFAPGCQPSWRPTLIRIDTS